MKKMAALLAGAALMVTAGSAWAIPTLKLTDGTTTVVIEDGGVGDSNALAGVVTYTGSVGSNWILNVSTGITKPFQGTELTPYMDLNSVNSTSLGAGTLSIYFSETGFAYNPAVTGFTTNVGGTTGGTFELLSYYDPTNTLFGTTDELANLGPYTAGSFSGTDTDYVSAAERYSLTLEGIITHTQKATTSFDAELTPVPEPGTMVLLGAGILGLGIYGRRRAKK